MGKKIMWSLDELEKEISDKRFWAWRHCTGSMSVGYRVQLRGAYSNRRFRVYMEKSEVRPYGPPEVHIVFENAELMTGAEMLRRVRRPDDGRALTVSSQWPLVRRLSNAPRILLEETIWAAYRMYENEDRRVARQVLRHEHLPDEILHEIIEFI